MSDPDPDPDPDSDPDDFPFDAYENGIFLRGDGWRVTAPWKLQAYDRAGPLTDAQIDDLAAAFDLDRALLRALSRSLGTGLDPGQNIYVVPISRTTATRRATADLAVAKKNMKTALARLDEALDRLMTLWPEDVPDGDDVKQYRRILERMDEHTVGLRAVEADLAAMTASPGRFLKMTPEDKRLLRDRRRDAVLHAVFQTWVDAGRTVGFTTDPITSERHGQLIDFAQGVVACVTDPPTPLAGEAIAREILKSGKSVRPTAEWMAEWMEIWNARKKID